MKATSNTTTADQEFIYSLFGKAIAYQMRKGYPVWKGYDKNAFLQDFAAGNQYKIGIDDQIAIVVQGERHSLKVAPVDSKRNAWIGAMLLSCRS